MKHLLKHKSGYFCMYRKTFSRFLNLVEDAQNECQWVLCTMRLAIGAYLSAPSPVRNHPRTFTDGHQPIARKLAIALVQTTRPVDFDIRHRLCAKSEVKPRVVARVITRLAHQRL